VIDSVMKPTKLAVANDVAATTAVAIRFLISDYLIERAWLHR